MAAYDKTTQLIAAVTRLTGVAGVKSREGKRFRVEVTSSDGRTVGVTVQVNDHGTNVKSYQLSQIARKLCLSKDELREALDNWAPAELGSHLGSKTYDELKPGGRH